jgi:signal transduction histidine kinase
VAPAAAGDNLAVQVGARYDRWVATSQHPRLVKDVYVTGTGSGLQHFNPATRFLEPAEWPAALGAVRRSLAAAGAPQAGGGAALVHTPVPALWPDAPALVVTAPMVFIDRVTSGTHDVTLPSQSSYCVLLLDDDYIRRTMLPALARQHFQSPTGGFDYEVAVVPANGNGVVYHSADDFSPRPDARVDASADLFHLRVQDFGPLAAEISRFALFTAYVPGPHRGDVAAHTETVIRHTLGEPMSGTFGLPDGRMSIIVQEKTADNVTATVSGQGAGARATTLTNARYSVSTAAHWRLLVQHPSGSLEQAVNRVRRRNLLVSTGILGLLAASVGFLVVSTRRAQDLARQQLEFVATVSHELRTPLAVIRSAADNLADGVVGDEARVRQYGQLLRGEGVRLTELVEQILEFAGLQSGQRGIVQQPVPIDGVLADAAAAAQTSADAAGARIELSIAEHLPAVAGDEPALRRVFLNLIDNAIKYGAPGRWVGVRAVATAAGVEVAVSDRGIGIAPAEQTRIFEPFYRTPDVVAAQIQGAGLGLSLVKRIVEAHGGRIAVTSAPGDGSTFTVTLPAMTGDQGHEESEGHEGYRHSGAAGLDGERM